MLSTMRRNGRWAKEERFTREIPSNFEDPLIRSFKSLHDYLQSFEDITHVDAVVFLQPFLDVVSFPNTNGAMTGRALSSINKFLLYGAVTPENPRSRHAINLAVSSIVECKFEATNSYSDEVVLIQLLEVMENLLRCPVGGFISDKNVWKMIETSYRLNQGTGTSQLLRSTAANSLTHMILTLFSRSSELITEAAILQYNLPLSATVQKVVEPMVNLEVVRDFLPPSSSTVDEVTDVVHYRMGSASLAATVLRSATSSENSPVPYGLPILAQLLDFIATLSDPSRNDEAIRVFALQLINIILESGGEILAISPEDSQSPIITILQGDLCKHLLQNSQSLDLSVLSLTLRVIFNLFNAMKGHLKVQLEVFLTSVHLRIAESSSSSYEQKELALESLLDFCREPALMLDLYTNYDCDFRCTNLFETLCKCLCRCSIPHVISKHAPSTVDEDGDQDYAAGLENMRHLAYEYEGSNITVLEGLALEGVLAVVDSIAKRCDRNRPDIPHKKREANEDSESDDSDSIPEGTTLHHLARDHKANLLRERKKLKRRLMLVSKQFNKAPTKQVWKEYAQDLGVLPSDCTSMDVAEFFLSTPGLDKTAVGDYISEDPERKPFNNQVLHAYVGGFNFRGVRIDKALRMLLESFRLPGEAQKVDRLMDTFGKQYFEQNLVSSGVLMTDDEVQESDSIGVFKSGDAAFIFAFSIIMLHTDLHNPNIPIDRKMRCDQFVNNNRSTNEGTDVPRHLQESVFHSIQDEEMRMLYDPHEHSTSLINSNATVPGKTVGNAPTWANVLRHSQIVDKASFTPSSMGRLSSLRAGVHERDMFCIVFDTAVQSISFVFEMTNDGKTAARALEGFRNLAKVAVYFEMYDKFNQIVIILCRYFTRFFPALVEAGQNDNDLEGLSALRDTMVLSAGGSDPVRLVSSLAQAERFAAVASCRTIITFRAVLSLVKLHGSFMREGWRNFVQALLGLHELDMLPSSFVEVDDVVDDQGHRLPTLATQVQQYQQLKGTEEIKKSNANSTGFFSTLTSLIWAGDDEEDQIHTECKEIIRETLVVCRLNTVFSKSKTLSGDSVLLLMDALLVPLEVAEEGDLMFERTSVLCVELLTEVSIVNHERFEEIWEFLRRSFRQVLVNASALPEGDDEDDAVMTRPSNSPMSPVVTLGGRSRSSSGASIRELGIVVRPSRPARVRKASSCSIFVVERVVVSLLRVCIHMLDKTAVMSSLIGALGWFCEFSDELCASLATRIGSGLSTVLKVHAGYIKTSLDWRIVCKLIDTFSRFQESQDDMWNIVTTIVAEGGVTLSNLNILVGTISNVIQNPNSRHSATAVGLLLEISKHVMEEEVLTTRGRELSRRSDSFADDMEPALSPVRTTDTGGMVVDYNSIVPDKHESWMMLVIQIRGWFFDPRPDVSGSSMLCLQSALWSPPSGIAGGDWPDIFDKVLFPLLEQSETAPEKGFVECTNLLTRTFLHNLPVLTPNPGFHMLWLRVISSLSKRFRIVNESTLESIKNLIMVVQTEDVFDSHVWALTWTTIENSAPGIRNSIEAALSPIPPPQQ